MIMVIDSVIKTDICIKNWYCETSFFSSFQIFIFIFSEVQFKIYI